MCLQLFSCPAEALVDGIPAQTVAGGNGACVLQKEISAQENIGIPLWQRIQKRGNGPMDDGIDSLFPLSIHPG